MTKCCQEHVELALDKFVDKYETAPKIDKLQENQLLTACEYCQNTAIYIVSN